MGYRRADLAWAPLLAVSAGLSVSQVLVAGGDWLPLVMILLAYPAGRRMASLALALWVFIAVAFVGLALAFWRSPEPGSAWLTLVLGTFVTSVLPWWVGRYRRLRAEQREREHGIVAEQARLRERARIARDMHDSLGHELALIALHGGALELAGNLTDAQRRAAGELRAGAVRATSRLHDIVQVLGNADAALQPADESVDDLVRRAGGAGLRVRLRHDGPEPGWSPMARLAAHRVVQESLTNAARYAPDAPVTVTLARDGSGTRVEVVNEAPTQPAGGSGSGQGLIGLDERVRLAGGRLDAGPRPGGGWSVTAVLPDDGPPSGDGGRSGFALRVSNRLNRRRQLQTAALPLAVGLALVAGLVVVQLLTVTRTGLPEDRYDRLRLGQSRAQVEPWLPPREFGEAPRVVAEPPADANCVYYQAGTGLLTSADHLYRLCFADGLLVSKDRLERA
ncbi:sensor histidine kinase [Micromonospora sp. NPDC050397]|uniref:sensor histidine kinase n=1 Tax=Micromonospora sp. NPDC050397 TaxID=3364279 RepID=UPI00384AF20A